MGPIPSPVVTVNTDTFTPHANVDTVTRTRPTTQPHVMSNVDTVTRTCPTTQPHVMSNVDTVTLVTQPCHGSCQM